MISKVLTLRINNHSMAIRIWVSTMNKTFFGSDNVADFSGIDDERAKEKTTCIKFKWQLEHSLPE